ncbi:MAG: hypothetical protein EAZ24_05725, partial [Burkholderiales bacterium]
RFKTMCCNSLAGCASFHKSKIDFKLRNATYGTPFHIVRKMEKRFCLRGFSGDTLRRNNPPHSLQRTTSAFAEK